jgi:hypothetical protein
MSSSGSSLRGRGYGREPGPWGVVDATQSGVEEGVHNYAFESVGGPPLPDSDPYAGYTIDTALDSRLGSGAMFARRFPISGAS